MRQLFLILTLPLFILDYATKEYIVRHFEAPPLADDPRYNYFIPESVKVIDGIFDIVRVHNTGVAFGLGNGTEWANVVFGGITVAAILLIWLLWRSGAFPTRLSRVALALLISGIMGNMLDRFTRGYVVDFLHFYYNTFSWPSFNVADSCICVAAFLLFISAFQKVPGKEKTA